MNKEQQGHRSRNQTLKMLAVYLRSLGRIDKPFGLSLKNACKHVSRIKGEQPPQKPKHVRWKYIYDFVDTVAAPALKANPLLAPCPTFKREKPEDRKAFYLSDAWRALRYRALKLHGAACQCCGATAKSSGRPLHVDHIKPRSKFPHLELEITNLQVLCEDCNLGKSAHDDTDWRPKLVVSNG